MKRNPTVAIMDDDSEDLTLLENAFIKAGIKVATFHYPFDEERFNNECEKADVILLDHRLGGTNGANVANRLHKERKTQNKRVFIFTDAMREDLKGQLETYLTKDEILSNPRIVIERDTDIISMVVESNFLKQATPK